MGVPFTHTSKPFPGFAGDQAEGQEEAESMAEKLDIFPPTPAGYLSKVPNPQAPLDYETAANPCKRAMQERTEPRLTCMCVVGVSGCRWHTCEPVLSSQWPLFQVT